MLTLRPTSARWVPHQERNEVRFFLCCCCIGAVVALLIPVLAKAIAANKQALKANAYPTYYFPANQHRMPYYPYYSCLIGAASIEAVKRCSAH
jgi:hypothetical protein